MDFKATETKIFGVAFRDYQHDLFIGEGIQKCIVLELTLRADLPSCKRARSGRAGA
jgi:hypothetical protein